MKNTNILIVEDHPFALVQMSLLTQSICNCNIFEASSGNAGLEYFKKNNYTEVLITDINLPGINGIELIKQIKAIKPSVRVMVFTLIEQITVFKQLSKLGTDVIILKSDSVDFIVAGIKSVIKGQRLVSPEILDLLCETKLPDENNMIPSLTKRELEVLKHLANDKSTKEIAKIMNISLNTVELYRKNLKTKFSSNTIQGLISKAYQYGIL
jgi:DNA-binding NarL/FixJ family response regulator